MSTDPLAKPLLRTTLRDRRRALPPDLRVVADRLAAKNLITADIISPGAVVGAYYPLADETSPLPLLDYLRSEGHVIALPVTAPKGQPLSFRAWDVHQPLVKSVFGVLEPVEGDTVIPDFLIVPLLGFDAACQRLGYGAGHYDSTLAALRDQGRMPRTAGLAYQCQYLDMALPVEKHDIALDCIVTEDRLYWPPI